jgi:hypothetical protein
MKISFLLVAPALMLGIAMPAHAVSITIKRSGTFISPAHTLLQDFDGATTDPQGAGVTASAIAPTINVNTAGLPNIVNLNGVTGGVGIRPGDLLGAVSASNNAFPGLSTGKYLSIGSGESYTLNFATPLRSLAFALGSSNVGYKVVLTLGDNTTTTFNGSAAIAGNPTNWTTASSSNAYVRYDMGAAPGPANTIKSVTFSHQNSGTFFEIDNIYGGVPEPAMWAMLIGGFGMAGVALRNRRPVLTA